MKLNEKLIKSFVFECEQNVLFSFSVRCTYCSQEVSFVDFVSFYCWCRCCKMKTHTTKTKAASYNHQHEADWFVWNVNRIHGTKMSNVRHTRIHCVCGSAYHASAPNKAKAKPKRTKVPHMIAVFTEYLIGHSRECVCGARYKGYAVLTRSFRFCLRNVLINNIRYDIYVSI